MPARRHPRTVQRPRLLADGTRLEAPVPMRAAGDGRLVLAPELAGPAGQVSEGLVVAADGSCLRNPGAGGWGWFVNPGCWQAGGAARSTNNAMELTAVTEALRSVPVEPLVVCCDSRYVIDALTKWLPGWRRRRWTTASGTPVKNRDLIVQADQQLQARAAAGAAVRFVWVRGHSGHPLNEAADRVARKAAELASKGQLTVRGPGWTQPA